MSNPNPSKLDANQTLQGSFDKQKEALRVLSVDSLVPESYDEIDLTYVAAGNGVGEIETVTYSSGGSTVATLTLSYDANDNLVNITRT